LGMDHRRSQEQSKDEGGESGFPFHDDTPLYEV